MEFSDEPSALQREMDELELSLLRRGVEDRKAHSERCARCQRTPLVGEWVYLSGPKSIECELCHIRQEEPTAMRLVHTAAFGHTIRIVDQRAA